MNETIIGTVSELTFENVTAITQNPVILLALAVIWAIPLIIYIIIGIISKAKTASGRVLNSRMIETGNFWAGFAIWFIVQSLLIVFLLIFPIWLKILG